MTILINFFVRHIIYAYNNDIRFAESKIEQEILHERIHGKLTWLKTFLDSFWPLLA